MRAWIIAASLLSLSGCAGGVSGAPPKPASHVHGLTLPQSGPRVLIHGERFEARAEAVGLDVGKLRVGVSGPCDPKTDPKWGVEAKMGTAGVLAFFNRSRGEATSVIDGKTGVPAHSRTHVEDGHKWRDYEILPGDGMYRFRYEKSEGDLIRGRKPLPDGEPVYDTLTGFFAIRGWRPEPGAESYFYVILGRRLWRADVEFEGPTTLEVGGKKLDTVRFSGVAHRIDLEPGQRYEPRKFSVWLTDDEYRVPILVAGDGSVGSVTFHLEKHSFDAPCRKPDTELVALSAAPRRAESAPNEPSPSHAEGANDEVSGEQQQDITQPEGLARPETANVSEVSQERTPSDATESSPGAVTSPD